MNVRLLGFFLSVVLLAQTGYRVEVIAGSDWNGDGGPATRSLVAHIEGVAIDFDGNLFIADADSHRIRKVSPNGTISTFAGTGVRGFGGDGGPATEAAAFLEHYYVLCRERALRVERSCASQNSRTDQKCRFHFQAFTWSESRCRGPILSPRCSAPYPQNR